MAERAQRAVGALLGAVLLVLPGGCASPWLLSEEKGLLDLLAADARLPFAASLAAARAALHAHAHTSPDASCPEFRRSEVSANCGAARCNCAARCSQQREAQCVKEKEKAEADVQVCSCGGNMEEVIRIPMISAHSVGHGAPSAPHWTSPVDKPECAAYGPVGAVPHGPKMAMNCALNHASQYNVNSPLAEAVAEAVQAAMRRAEEYLAMKATEFEMAEMNAGQQFAASAMYPRSHAFWQENGKVAEKRTVYSTSQQATVLMFRHNTALKKVQSRFASFGINGNMGWGSRHVCSVPGDPGSASSSSATAASSRCQMKGPTCDPVNGPAVNGHSPVGGGSEPPLTGASLISHRQELAMASLFTRYGGVDAALEILERTAKLEPQDARVWNDLGNAHRAKGSYHRALDCMEQAIRLKTHPDLYLNLGSIHYILGNVQKAAEAFRQGLLQDAQHVLLHFSLANVLVTLGRKEEAVLGFEEALRLQPDFMAADVHLRQLKLQLRQQWRLSLGLWLTLLAFVVLCIVAQRLVKWLVTRQPVSPKPVPPVGRRKRR